MEMRDKVLAFVKAKGPVIPMQVAKDLGKDTFYAGAILSELLNSKIIKISSAKVGGTPVYYFPGQEEKLTMLYNGLPQKEKEAFNLLKEKKILKDKETEPAIRVALRAIKDFAIPFYNENQEIIWRWYLQNKEEQPVKVNVPLTPPQPTVLVQEPVMQVQQPIQQPVVQPLPKQPTVPVLEKSPLMQEKPIAQKEQKKSSVKKESADAFIAIIRTYLQNNHIQVLEEKILKKNKEYELIAKVPSNVGLLEYVVIAKNKKKIADSDLSLAHNQGQLKKLPVILLTNGELSKKAQEYKEKNLKGFMLVRKV